MTVCSGTGLRPPRLASRVLAGLLLLLGLSLWLPPTVDAQTVSSVRPSSGAPGTSVRIHGSGLSTGDAVTIGGTTATVTGGTATALTVTVPSGPVGTVNVVVNGTTLTSAFDVVTNGPGFFSALNTGLTGLQEGEVAWADFNGDGRRDAVVTGVTSFTPTTTVYRNDGGGAFSVFASLYGVGIGSADWGDLDGDGDPDLVITGSDDSFDATIRVYENDVANSNGFISKSVSLPAVKNSSVALGDVNGDGTVDIVLTGNDGTTPLTAVYTNAGSYTFNLLDETAGTGEAFANVEKSSTDLGDVDGDGDLDLIVTGVDGGGTKISAVYRNDVAGGNGFSLVNPDGNGSTTNLVGVSSGDAEWGDFDGDDDLDLVIVGANSDPNATAAIYENDGSENFSVFEDDGDGGTSGLPPIVDGESDWSDVDGDGDLDLLLSGSDTAAIYENDVANENGFSLLNDDGTGNTAFLGDVELSSSDWGDVDSDGDLDLLVMGKGPAGETTTIYENAAPPILSVRRSGSTVSDWMTIDAGTTPQGADLPTTLTVENTGSETPLEITGFSISNTTDFSAEAPSTLPVSIPAGTNKSFEVRLTASALGSYSTDVTLEHSDLSQSPFTVTVEGTVVEGKATEIRPRAATPGTSVRIYGAGFTSDTDITFGSAAPVQPDAVTASGTAMDVTVPSGLSGPVGVTVTFPGGTTRSIGTHFNVVTGGGGLFTPLARSVPDVDDGVVDWVDVDGDGDLDLFISGADADGDRIAAVYVNEGGSFSLLNPDGSGNTTGLTGTTGGSSDWGDYDGDGDPDLVLTGEDPSFAGSTTIYENEGGNSFSKAPASSVLDGVLKGSSAWGDADGDGDLDLVITGQQPSEESYAATIYRNDGTGSFSVLNDDGSGNTTGLTPVYESTSDWADIDGDGDLDLLITGNDTGGPSAALYRNDGTGSFSIVDDGDGDGSTNFLNRVKSGAVAWGDYDSDGDPDLVITGNNGSFPSATIYRNDGTGTFSVVNDGNDDGSTNSLTKVEFGAVAWSDVDGDGDLDLYVSGQNVGQSVAAVYENEGGTFSALNPNPIGNSAKLIGLDRSSSAWGDLDGDGDLDLAMIGAIQVEVEAPKEPRTFLYENVRPLSRVYVAPTGDDDNDGSSWGSAYRTLQKALQRALPSATEAIWIAEGRYVPDQGPVVIDDDPSTAFRLVNDVDLYGGFEGTESSRAERNAAAHPTILSGDIDNNDADPNNDGITADAADIQGSNSYNVLTGGNLSQQVRLDGLVLTGGDARNTTSFFENTGGGLRLRQSNVLGVDLRLLGNKAGSGGAIYGDTGSTTALYNSILHGNEAATGSGYSGDGEIDFTNSVLVRNQGAGAVIDAESNVNLYTVTATQNEGVIAEVINSTIRAENSILWGNNGESTQQLRPDDGDSSVDLVNVLLEGGTSGGVDVSGGGSVSTATNVIDADPLFANPSGTGPSVANLAQALRLSASSPAFDAGVVSESIMDDADLDRDGNTTEAIPLDLQGNSRVLNRSLDLGAFERRPPSIQVEPGTAKEGQETTLTFTIAESFSPDTAAELYIRKGGAKEYASPLSLSPTGTAPDGATQLAAPISGSSITPRGLDYYAVLNNGITTLTVPAGGFPDTAKVRPAHLPTSVTDVTANAPFTEEAYQMVSVPAEPASGILGTLRDTSGEHDPADWRVLRWDPTRSTYREPPELDTLAPGMGAWLITERGTPFRVSGTTVDAASPRKIPLPAGWSQVGTPFGFAVPWDSVRTTSGRSVDAPVGYDADNGFRYNRSTLTPWQGYFVYNPSDADTLVVPPIGTDDSDNNTTSTGVLAGSGLGGTGVAKAGDGPPIVRVDARTGDDSPQSVWLGLHSDAKTGRDALDFAQAPPVDADVQLSILETIGGTTIPHAGSFKPVQGDGQTWSLQLRRSETASSSKTISLFPQTSGSLPAGYNLYLLDAEEERRITSGESVSLAPGERSSLTLILGTEAYAKRSGAAGLGTYENELRGNAPNPFSDQTTISYVLARDQEVTLTIFNVLGQRVRTLVQDRRSKGLHHVTWDGTTQYGDGAGSGVYFYRLQGEDFTATRKMVLIR